MAFGIGHHSPPSSTRQAYLDKLTSRAWDFAAAQAYVGPTKPGPTLCGWPLADLLAACGVPPPDRTDIAVRLHTMVGGQAAGPPLQSPPTPARNSATPEAMLAMRMRWDSWAPGFEHCDVHVCSGKVYVWIITKGNFEPVTIIDEEEAMFPSDTLITKLRLLEK